MDGRETDGAYMIEMEIIRPGVTGMTVAASHADPADIRAVRGIVERMAATREPFTSDDVRANMTDEQNDRLDAFPHSLGAVFFSMQKQEIIVGIGYARARRDAARGRPLRLWRGVVIGE